MNNGTKAQHWLKQHLGPIELSWSSFQVLRLSYAVIAVLRKHHTLPVRTGRSLLKGRSSYLLSFHMWWAHKDQLQRIFQGIFPTDQMQNIWIPFNGDNFFRNHSFWLQFYKTFLTKLQAFQTTMLCTVFGFKFPLQTLLIATIKVYGTFKYGIIMEFPHPK